MKRLLILFLLMFFVLTVFSCSERNEYKPVFKKMGSFSYRFAGCRHVIIKYQGITYNLRQHDELDGDRFSQLPFVYEFENDGDLDIRISGRDYDLDSPCDIDYDPFKSSKRRYYGNSRTKVVNKTVVNETVINRTVVQDPKRKEIPNNITKKQKAEEKKALKLTKKKEAKKKKALELTKKKDKKKKSISLTKKKPKPKSKSLKKKR